MNSEDAAHGHEAQAEKEHPVLRDLHRGDCEQNGQAEGQKRDGGHDVEVL